MTRADVLEFEVIPERCLSNENVEFHLGTPINQVITMLQQNARVLPNVDLMYSKKDPFSRDICLHLLNGIKLVFDARTQLLKLIEVGNLSKIVLKYRGQTFSEPGDEATTEKVEESFGSTHPGEYDVSEKVYTQSWRGLSFCFPTRDSSHVEVTDGFASLRSLKYDTVTSPRLTKMTIFRGTAKGTESLEVPLACYCGQNRLILAESINKDKKIAGMKFTILTEDKPSRNSARSNDYELVKKSRSVMFGDHVATVQAALGAPSKVFYKSDDKMSIHKGNSRMAAVDPQPHFFFNYFSMGFDILFDFTTKRVLKFVLHTNIPGHYHFGVYSRCEFRVAVPGEEDTVLDTTSKFESFARVVDSQQPVVINRQTTEERNPFGPTFAYGTSQIVVEVMDTQNIAAVTIFQ